MFWDLLLIPKQENLNSDEVTIQAIDDQQDEVAIEDIDDLFQQDSPNLVPEDFTEKTFDTILTEVAEETGPVLNSSWHLKNETPKIYHETKKACLLEEFYFLRCQDWPSLSCNLS